MEIDPHVVRLYERYPEHERLWEAGKGELTRLRTWDLFDRYLPPAGRVLDVGGGPGVHASYLAGRGYEVVLTDPMLAHLARARERAAEDGHAFATGLGTAAEVGEEDASVDAVLLMGPLYHLIDPDDRLDALAEARRVLRPGGRLIAEAITRHTWTIDGVLQGVVDRPGELDHMAQIADTGFSDPRTDGGFWAHFHRPAELRDEVEAAGFTDVTLVAVEGFAWLLGDLAARMADPDPLLAAIRLTETDESMLGVSAHVMAIATAPEPVDRRAGMASVRRHPSSAAATAGERLTDDIRRIQSRVARLPVLDARPADEILGYDDNGLPTGSVDLDQAVAEGWVTPARRSSLDPVRRHRPQVPIQRTIDADRAE